ncbi:MAG: ATP-dependent DNA helicase RecQ [Chloroflexi bacterium ADurb.Bin360]|nr:MAG: ATP-dependent DNA helicase RecQ [Chloroflexi bacterium ADurb.Bin360]
MKDYAHALLQQMLGPGADFRPGQWEAIEIVALQRGRALVVQRTGWGKSLVYFLATRLLREQGAGPTLLVSPLLSLMRNQIAMSQKIGLRAITINSANRDEWEIAEQALAHDACDLLLISPERLNNEHFLKSVLPVFSGRVGLFVVDEAHCISEWGHDFRPDYRRIVRILRNLPAGVPVLGTTATANDRVVADVQAQLGAELKVLRGPLARASLRLQNIRLADQSERLAWLARYLPQLPGSGIVYCLTVADTQRVAAWLNLHGITAVAYHAGDDVNIDRAALEQALLDNEIKALVATVALGMGFDKPDLGFVIHFQRPGSVIAYYQQVGRAGRAVDRAYGILLSGREDDEIQEYFIQSAFPGVTVMQDILWVLERFETLSVRELLAHINVSQSMMEKALKLLEVDGAVGKSGSCYFRTPNPWHPDVARMEQVTALRRNELAQMQAYVTHTGCLMEFLGRALDDPAAAPCGRCANCVGQGLPAEVPSPLVIEAVEFLQGFELPIEPRKLWPGGLFPDLKAKIPIECLNAPGRALCEYGDAGWGKWVREGKYLHEHFSDDLVAASARLIAERWHPEPFPAWVTAIPSRRRPRLVYDFAERLATALGLPFVPVLERIADAPEQKTMANSAMQARNVNNTLTMGSTAPRPAPVLLVDDIVDSRWTLTLAGWLLRTHGSGLVYPFVLARAAGRGG